MRFGDKLDDKARQRRKGAKQARDLEQNKGRENCRVKIIIIDV